MSGRFVEELTRRVLVFDGAMGTSLHARDLEVATDYAGCENCTDVVVRTRPEIVREIHASFFEAGADVVETNTFGANRVVLGEFGLEGEAYGLNLTAARLAREAAEAAGTPGRPRFVAGSMGPGTRLASLGQIDWETMRASYEEQAGALVDGGVDVLVVETCQDLMQARSAVVACLDALEARRGRVEVPIMVSVTIERTGSMLAGSSIEAAAAALEAFPILSLGVNCATGPDEMLGAVSWLGREWARAGRYVSVMPNAGLPEVRAGRAHYGLSPGRFAEAMAGFVREHNVRIVGGCCGTTPAHIRALAAALEGRREGPEPVGKATRGRALASLFGAVEYRQDASLLIVGERMNASGSRAFRRLLEAGDWEGIAALAREQVEQDGAHVLDVNVDVAGRDNAADMREVVARVSRVAEAPLMLDSTQAGTLEAGLRAAPGRSVINSANFEEGEAKFDALCRMARRYGAGLVIGSIDEDREASMARTRARKLEIARRAHARATRVHGLDERDLFFDPLVLPVSTGLESDRRSALETVEGVRAIAAAFPEAQTIAGVSNVSFGLSARARVVLNSAFLHEMAEAGLTSAIVHASRILPRDRIDPAAWEAAMEVIHDRRRPGHDPLSAFISMFEGAAAGVEAPAAARTVEERLRAHIVEGRKKGLVECLEEALERHPPLAIINDHLLEGMKTVGELFGSGRMQLPFVLQSAEVMKAAVAHLEPRMERVRGGVSAKGTIVLATVRGDVHDIGKNLVDIILTNNGYKVVNLGIKQPLEGMVRAWQEHGASVIGMSGLLVKSVQVMEENLRELNERGLFPTVLVGGAALTRHYAEGHLRKGYSGELLYAKDAFEGLRVMEHVVAGRTADLGREISERLAKRSAAEETILRSRVERTARGATTGATADAVASGTVERAERIPSPPFWGSRVVEGIDLGEVYPYINEVALFRGQWQVRKGAAGDAEHEAFVREKIRPVFERLKREGREKGILRPAVVYGYFPCRSEGNDVVVYDPAEGAASRREVERFTFPRQAGGRGLCIADFFRRMESEEADTLAMHCVTVGSRATEQTRRLFEGGEYAEYLYLHGLSVETAEALAEMWHKRVREELGIAGADAEDVRALFTQHYQGSRYSFGYPACPELSDQGKLWRLLGPERIGCRLTENWQIDPEQSTSAIIVHHPAARYFGV